MKSRLRAFLDRLFRRDDGVSRLLKNSTPLFAAETWVFAAHVVEGFIVARFLGAADYGIIALIVSFVTIVNQVLDFRVHETATRYTAEFLAANEREKAVAAIKLCYIIDAATGVLAFIAIVLTAGPAAQHILHQPAAAPLIVWYAVRLLFSTVDNTSHALLGVLGRFTWFSTVHIVTTMIELAVVSFLVWSGFGIKGVIAGYVAASLASSISFFSFALLAFSRAGLTAYRSAPLSLLAPRAAEMGRFLVSTNINELFVLIIRNADILVLGYFRAPREVGYYRLAKSFVSIFGLISSPLYRAVYPQLSSLWHAGAKIEFRNVIRRSTKLVAAAVIAAAIIITILIPPVIHFTVGDAFMPSVSAIRIMAWGMAIPTIFYWTRPALLAMGKAGFLTAANAISVVITILLSLALVPKFGYKASAWLFMAPYLISHAIIINSYLKTK